MILVNVKKDGMVINVIGKVSVSGQLISASWSIHNDNEWSIGKIFHATTYIAICDFKEISFSTEQLVYQFRDKFLLDYPYFSNINLSISVKCTPACMNGICLSSKTNSCRCDIGWSGPQCNESTTGNNLFFYHNEKIK